MKRVRLKRTGRGFRPAPHIEQLNQPCALCGCWGEMDVHHLVPKRVLHEHCKTLRWDPAPWLVDPRNLVNLHRSPCHERVERRKAYVRLPDEAWAFAAELGVTYWLERYERQAAA